MNKKQKEKFIKMAYCMLCYGLWFDLYYNNTIVICRRCFDGANTVKSGLEKLKPDLCKSTTHGVPWNGPNPHGSFANALKCLNAVKETEEQLREKFNFLGEYSSAYKNQLHCDIQLKSGDNGTPIPAHRSLLVSRSDIFKNMLDSDKCKASVPSETITLQEMTQPELESFLEFLYSGELPKDKMEKNVYALTRAAHKYEIPFLQKYCEKQMCSSLNASNVLDLLEVSCACYNKMLKRTALNFIAEHMEEVVFSDKFYEFADRNPRLTAQITRVSTTRYQKIINQDNRPNKAPRVREL